MGSSNSNGDIFRDMSDEELSRWILENVNCDKENIMCVPTEYKNSGKCSGKCLDGRLAWLKHDSNISKI